jgi:anti-sigma28 factor (negative regulator of flagellin synthesis)
MVQCAKKYSKEQIMSVDKKIIEREVYKLRPEIKEGMYKIFEDALTTINMNIPELHEDRDAAVEIYKTMMRVMEMIKNDIDEGKYDHY